MANVNFGSPIVNITIVPKPGSSKGSGRSSSGARTPQKEMAEDAAGQYVASSEKLLLLLQQTDAIADNELLVALEETLRFSVHLVQAQTEVMKVMLTEDPPTQTDHVLIEGGSTDESYDENYLDDDEGELEV